MNLSSLHENCHPVDSEAPQRGMYGPVHSELPRVGMFYHVDTYLEAFEKNSLHYFYPSPNRCCSYHTLRRLRLKRHALSNMGAAMTDIQIMTKIICTLPPSYRNFASVWDNVQVHERTISLLTSRLLKEESNDLR